MASNGVRKNSVVIPDDLITCINDFKATAPGQMVPIHGKEYATVAHRLAILRRNFGARARIETFILDINENKVVTKAMIFIDNKMIATGMAEEDRKASRINQTSALEVSETSAIGRALAFCGITNDNVASAEEVTAAIEQQDKKIQAAITEVKSVSHAGNYQEWLSKHKTFLANLKETNPISYKNFQEQFTNIKSQLKNKGVSI